MDIIVLLRHCIILPLVDDKLMNVRKMCRLIKCHCPFHLFKIQGYEHEQQINPFSIFSV